MVEIRLLSLLEGAREATGQVVIIDVYRAFTTAAVAFRQGAREIVLVGEPERALTLRRDGRGDLLLGERGGIMVPGFDLGNSPHALAGRDLTGQRLILCTSAGTRGVAAVSGATCCYLVALVNASATAGALLAEQVSQPATISLVAMGNAGVSRSDEDELCGLYLRNRLLGREMDTTALATLVRQAGESAKFDDPAQPWFDPRDRNLALQVDAIPIAMRVENRDGLPVALPVSGR